MTYNALLGYLFSIAGVMLLCWNAYLLFAKSDFYTVSTAMALFFCVAGGVIINKSRVKSE